MGISEAATKEANTAVEKALDEDRQPRKRKYQHITPDSVQKLADMLLKIPMQQQSGNSAKSLNHLEKVL